MTEKDYFSLVQMISQVLSDFDSISRHSLNGHRWSNRSTRPLKSSSFASLIPQDHREVLFKGPQHWGCRNHRGAGTTVQPQENRIIAILTSNLYPLINPADGYERCLTDAAGSINCQTGLIEKQEVNRSATHQ